MYLVFTVLLAALVLSLSLATHDAYSRLYDSELCQIATDNAVFDLAERDRTLFENMERVNRQLRAAHLAHHIWHSCAQVPVSRLQCEVPDRALELEIQVLSRSFGQSAALIWKANPNQASGQWTRLGVERGHWRRVSPPPFSVDRCKVCALPILWRADLVRAATQARSCAIYSIEAAIEWKRGGSRGKGPEKYSYRLVR